MIKLIKTALILILVTDLTFSQENPFVDDLEDYLEELSQDDNFGLSIMITKGGERLLQKSYGYASREHGVLNTINSKFNIASIGKLFTAVAIFQLRERGLIDLDKSVGHYLPDFPNQSIRDSTTIQQLLTHTSGLPLWFNDEFDRQPKFDYLELSDYLALYEEVGIDNEQTGVNSYSNVGFIILGFVIETVSNTSYSEYLQKYIFEPLKMHDTGLWKLTEIIPNLAVGYVRPASRDDWWKTNYHLNMGGSPAGGAYSSPGDLVKFYNGLISNEIISKASWALMSSPQTETPYGAYGYGVGIRTINDQAIIGHLGGYYGVRGELMWYKTSDYVVAILANSDQTDYIDVSHFIQTQLAGTEAEKAAHRQTLELMRLMASKESSAVDRFNQLMAEGGFDEALIQIKGYYHFNNQNYEEAGKLFSLNYKLFPESESAKRDAEMISN